ncbi:MAG: hypothetical protein ACFCD0_27715 [Gemmataceae bacterium]
MRHRSAIVLSFFAVTWLSLAPSLLLAGGQPEAPKKPKSLSLEAKIYYTLGVIANRGTDIFNPPNSDPLSCAYLFEGGLLGILPQLDNYPELQKDIVDGLDSAALEKDAASRALELRKVIDGVREDLKPYLAKKTPMVPTKGNGQPKHTEPNKGESKQTTEPKKSTNQYPKLIQNKPAPPVKVGPVKGRVAFQGQLLQGVLVVLWTKDFKKLAQVTDVEGRFEFPGPIPVREYLVTVSLPIPEYQAPPDFPRIPQRYSNPLLTELKVQTQEKGVELTLDLR